MSESKLFRHAIIITAAEDSYLKVLSNTSPVCLTPLVNVPIIHYLILNLLKAKITNFTIFCGKHKKAIRKFIKDVRYNDYSLQSVKFEFNGDDNLETVGEVIRYLDEKKFEKEFILVHGDLITDCDFSQLINNYQISKQQNKKQNKTLVMATVAAASQNEYTKPYDWAMIDKDNNIVTKDGKELEKYCDPQIYICSEMVVARMQEHQDCSSMYDLIDSILAVSEAVNDVVNVITCDQTCMRLVTFNAYMYMTTKIIRGNVSGCSPPSIFDDNVRTVRSDSPIISSHHSAYLSADLPRSFLHCSSQLLGNVSVMSDSTLGENSRLIDSIIGKNCKIGSNVILRRCVLLDNAVVKDGCLLSEAVVGANVTIGERAKVVDGVTITEGSVIDGGVRLKGTVGWADQRVLSDRREQDQESLDDGDDDDDPFQTSLHELIHSSIDEDVPIDILLAEVRKAQVDLDRDQDDSVMGLSVALVMYPLRVADEAGTKYGQRVRALFARFSELISRVAGGGKTGSERRRLALEAVEEVACSNGVVMAKAADIVFSMYEAGVVREEDVRRWHRESSLLGDTEVAKETATFRENLAVFMDYLDDDDDDSASEESN